MPSARPPTPRPGRKGIDHPEIRRLGRGVWHPELVGVVRGYPKTQEAFDIRQAASSALMARLKAEGKWRTRRGVPDGFGGGRAGEARRAREAARELATKIWKTLVSKKLVKDDEYAELAFTGAAEALLAKDEKGDYVYPLKDRLVAMRLIADFHKAKPVTKVEATVGKPEDWLAALAAQELTEK